MIRYGLFITGTGTSVGKTWVTRGLARAFVRRGLRVAAIKPIETGCDPDPADATVLGRSCGRADLAEAPGLYRARAALSPYAALLEGESSAADPTLLARRCRELAASAGVLLVEGAGGLLAPLDRTHDIADLARALELPLLLVADDALGVLSLVLTAVESARARSLPLAAVVLTQRAVSPADPSRRSNRRILSERLDVPVLAFPSCPDDDDALALAAEQAGLVPLVAPAS